ncbi:MAG TPA: hypothetical protein DIT67_09455 [Octadecabacter sp.]|nr:hypothetical protein [Octadecabacter sp.]
MTHTLTRRTLLASVPAITAIPLPCLASAPRGPADLFQLWLAEKDYINGVRGWSDEELDIACGPMDALEDEILTAPVHTAQDLAVKLVVSSCFGVFGCNKVLREAAAMLGQSHRIPSFVSAH